MTEAPPQAAATTWLDALAPYLRQGPIAALLLGISSGFPYAMIAATLTTRLAQDGFDKKSVTAFSLAFLVYNFKPLWAWVVDAVPIPGMAWMGQRKSWMILSAVLAMLAVANLGMVDPKAVGSSPVGQLMVMLGLSAQGELAALFEMAVAAILVGFAGATFDIVIDAYRIEVLKPEELGVGSGMSQYGWRIGSTVAAALALWVAARSGWDIAYLVCTVLALPAVIAVMWIGEPERRRETHASDGERGIIAGIIGPFAEFFGRSGAWLVLVFILVHKVGDTLANLTLRLLLDDLQFTNDEIAIFDVATGFWGYLIGIFIGGVLYAKLGLKRSVLISLVLMGVSNFSFAMLAAAGHSNLGLAATMAFETVSSGIGGVVVTAYFSALCDLRFTAAHFALISSAASIVGRFINGTSAGWLMETLGNVNFYLLTTAAALPGILLFWWMMRAGLVEQSVGSAGSEAFTKNG